jgi:excisionase family DNA binding protein
VRSQTWLGGHPLTVVGGEVAQVNESEAFTIPEVCERTRVGRTSIRAAINSGELRAVKCGRRTLILPNDLRRWLATLPAVKPTAHFVTRDPQIIDEKQEQL